MRIGVGGVLVVEGVAFCCVVLHGRLAEPAFYAPVYVCERKCSVLQCSGNMQALCFVLPCVAVRGSSLLARLKHTAKH